MKVFRFTLCFYLLSSGVTFSASGAPFRQLDEQKKSWFGNSTVAVVSGLMSFRCGYFSGKRLSLYRECRRAALHSFKAALDWGEWPLAFYGDLEKFVDSGSFFTYTDAISKTLENKEECSLWESSVAFFDGDSIQALQYISTILQDLLGSDGSGFDTDIPTYLKEEKKISAQDPQLEKYIAILNYIGQRDPHQSGCHLYPPEIESRVNHIGSSYPRIYHFYVIARIAYALRHQYGVSGELSSFISFIFDVVYNHGMDVGIKYFLYDPKTLDLKNPKHLTAISDIYLAYLGAIFGAQDFKIDGALSFEEFKQAYAESPRQFFRNSWRQKKEE